MSLNPEVMRRLGEKQRYDRELEIFRNRWSDVLKNGDEYYNKNFPITIAPFTLD